MTSAPLAKITDRFLAYLLDTLPFGAGYYASAIYLIGVSRRLPPESWRQLALGWLAAYLLYHSIGNRSGGTFGKRLMGLGVAGPDGAAPGIGRSVVRSIGLLLSTPFDLGFLWAFVDRDSRGWHDLLAGTRVVETRPKSAAESRATALAAFATLGGLLLVTAWVHLLRPTPEDALAVAKAQDGLEILARIEERHKAAHGGYTQSLAELALASGDVERFKSAMRDLFDGRQFLIAADRERFVLSARAKDRRRTAVSLAGPLSSLPSPQPAPASRERERR